jgi:hypothetical protein
MTNEAPKFEWANDEHAEVYRSLSSLIKYNRGYFKSEKQAWFYRITERTSSQQVGTWDSIKLGKYNIDINMTNPHRGYREDDMSLGVKYGVINQTSMGQYTIILESMVEWAPGLWGHKKIYWAFVLDREGVVRKYKVPSVHQREEGRAVRMTFRPDPSRAELQFEREEIRGAQPIVDFVDYTPGALPLEMTRAKYYERGDSYTSDDLAYSEALRELGYLEIKIKYRFAKSNDIPEVMIGKVIKETEKATFFLDVDGRKQWLPKSQYKVEDGAIKKYMNYYNNPSLPAPEW